jgi:hypothetical protein
MVMDMQISSDGNCAIFERRGMWSKPAIEAWSLPLVLFIQLLASVCPKYRQNRWVGDFELAGKAAGAYPETALS